MYFSTMRLVLVVLVTAALVQGGRYGGRSRYNLAPNSYSSREKLMNLKSQLYSCMGRYVCDVRTVNNLCQVECINEDRVCDGTMDCMNGRDEMGCQVETPCPTCTCEPCPEATPCPTLTCEPCPEETPCPTCGCPEGSIRCGDGSACITFAEACDMTADCPAGDTVEDNASLCA